MVKLIIFDLDDTLYDCSNTLVVRGRRRVARTIAGIINCTEEEAYLLQSEIEEEYGTKVNIYEKIVAIYRLPRKYIREFLEEFIQIEISDITPFPDVITILKKLKAQGYTLALVTSGEEQIQTRKIEVLGLSGSYFDDILIARRDTPPTKKDHFRNIIQRYRVKQEEIICVGDKIDDELTAGKSLGITTVMIEHGRHYKAYVKEPEKHIKPDYFIKNISCLHNVLAMRDL
ncbi:MAG: HAD family hydrolase [Candidatus Loosdrechtia sp.]|uniref:HAD family hydrolase n=1 Tax=Candidatus Loosdrechtia sp. TaxID=3101272 RepID=UPI003A6FB0AA|nr:MAG: HAD hydrolase-like protein [Candidatus Jettenia sp. AMX2]